jgi:hypothetical protein
MASPVELIPGTAIPISAPSQAPQPENRGTVLLTPERMPHRLAEGDGKPDEVTVAQLALLDAALRAYDRSPKFDRAYMAQASALADVTTGNLVLPLFDVPQGAEAHLVFVTVDTPLKATVTPTAPAANAATWSYLAVLPTSSGQANAQASLAGGFRNGLVDFAPNPASTTGAALPFRWVYDDSTAPIAWGGESFWYVQIGGSQASVANATVKVNYRVNLWSHAR